MQQLTTHIAARGVGEGLAGYDHAALDPFTIQHLATWCEHVVFDDEREAFTAYALDALADDPSLADLGWPAMLNAFHDA